MRLAVVTRGNADNPRTWSGAVMNSVKEFRKYDGVEVIPIDLNKLIYSLFRRIVTWTLNRVFYIKGSPRDPFHFKHDSKVIEKAIKDVHPDVCLFYAEHCLREKDEKIKYYTYIDATLRPLNEADPIKRIGRSRFLVGYERNERICFDNYDGVFTMNEWSRESVHFLYGKSIESMYNVGCGINTVYYEGEKDYTNKKMLIVIRKGTERYKGLELLLEAFDMLYKKDDSITLSVVGTDGKKKAREGVTYYYQQPREVTVRLFQESSLYVMPAIREPNGITYLEALANKTPIVGLERFAVPEFCGNGKYGFMAKEADAEELASVIMDAFSDPDRLKVMGEAGQAFVRDRYDWSHVVSQMMDRFTENN